MIEGRTKVPRVLKDFVSFGAAAQKATKIHHNALCDHLDLSLSASENLGQSRPGFDALNWQGMNSYMCDLLSTLKMNFYFQLLLGESLH